MFGKFIAIQNKNKMKKLLTFLWIVIIGGLIFIAISIFKPESHQNGITDVQPEEDVSTPVETLESTEIQEEQPKSYTEYIQHGDNAMIRGDFQKAIDSYVKAVNIKSRSLDPLMRLGEAYLANNQPKNAEDIFQKAKESDPESLEISIAIARSLINQRNYQAAKSIVFELDQTIPDVQYYSGVLRIIGNDTEGAKAKFTEIVESEESIRASIKENAQKFLDAYEVFSYFKEGSPLHLRTLLAKVLTEVKEYDAAIAVLFDILDEKNNYTDAWIILGYAYLNTQKYGDAIDAFNQARARDPEKPQTLFFLGLSHFANDEIDEAIKYLEDASKEGYEPKEELDLKLADLYLYKKEYNKAAMRYENVLAKNTNNLEIFVRPIWLYIDKLNSPTNAHLLAIEALKNHPKEPMSYNLMGWALTANQNYEEGQIYLQKAIEMNPDFDAAYLNLGWLYEKKGSEALAKEYYKKAHDLGGNNSIANLAAIRYNNLVDPQPVKATATTVTTASSTTTSQTSTPITTATPAITTATAETKIPRKNKTSNLIKR